MSIIMDKVNSIQFNSCILYISLLIAIKTCMHVYNRLALSNDLHTVEMIQCISKTVETYLFKLILMKYRSHCHFRSVFSKFVHCSGKLSPGWAFLRHILQATFYKGKKAALFWSKLCQ